MLFCSVSVQPRSVCLWCLLWSLLFWSSLAHSVFFSSVLLCSLLVYSVLLDSAMFFSVYLLVSALFSYILYGLNSLSPLHFHPVKGNTLSSLIDQSSLDYWLIVIYIKYQQIIRSILPSKMFYFFYFNSILGGQPYSALGAPLAVCLGRSLSVVHHTKQPAALGTQVLRQVYTHARTHACTQLNCSGRLN